MCASPALAPLNVIPRMKKMVSTRYGNMDVKYTTWKKRMIYYQNDRKMTAKLISSARLILIDIEKSVSIYLELTLPDDCIPFMTMKNTIIQLSKRQRTIHHLRPWPSSMDGAASNVVLYQKYAVSELLAHSSTGFPFNSGHFAHGSDF